MHRNRLAAIALMILAVLTVTGFLAGCGRREAYGGSSSATFNGRTVTVSVGSPTELDVTLDGQTYTYTRTPDGTSSSIAGPDNAPSSDYELVDQVVAQWLVENPQWQHPRRTDPGLILVGLIMIGLGVFSLVKPTTVWYISDGWKFRNAEPSDLALSLTRFGGVVMVVVGLIMIANAH